MKQKTLLAAAVILALAPIAGGVNAASDELDAVIVEANREENETLPGGFLKENGAVGLLGSQDVMDTPFTVATISNQAIEQFSSPYNGISDALSFNPSVRADRGGTYTDISIRGIYQSGHSFYVNGIPGLMDQQNIPYCWVDSVTVTSGPNLGVNGSTLNEAIGGVVNMTSKRAGEKDNTDVKLAYRGGSSFEEAIDVGRRFGEDNRYGIRITANNIQGETTIDGEDVTQRNFFVNLDQRTSSSKTNLLMGYNYVDHKGGPGSISFDSAVTKLPGAPDAGKLYKPDWTYNEYDNWIVGLNHEQKLNDHMTAFLNAGYHREDWYGYIDGNPKVINNNGDFTINVTNYPLALTKKYLGVGLKGDFQIGAVHNEYVVGVDRSWMNYWLGNNAAYNGGQGGWDGTGNLWTDNSWTNPGDARYNPQHNSNKQMTGWHIVDTMKMLDDKLQFTMGIHGHQIKTNMEGESKERKSDAITPTFALSYKFTPNLMVYADHTESFGEGSLVGSKYENVGEMLDPTKTKQNEIGVKVKTGKFLNTFSYFQIKQANLKDEVRPDGLWRVQDGEQENKGFEWAFTGNINDRWDLIGGVMYLDAKDMKGNDVDGAADWSATLGAIYHVNDVLSFLGRVSYMDDTTINGGQLRVPSATRFDLGASWSTKISHTPVTFRAMCYNVLDKNYWVARSGSSSLSIGTPRTFVLSANFSM